MRSAVIEVQLLIAVSSLLFVPAFEFAFAQHNHHHHHHSHRYEQQVSGLTDATDGDEIYSKHATGRHVCIQQSNSTQPIRARQAYCKPVYKKYLEKCNNNQLCSGVKLVYETTYRDVVIAKNTSQVIYICCPGWSQIDKRSHGCNKPKCKVQCENGGKCVKPDTCLCPKGFLGRYCEFDRNECEEDKPCDQICYNTIGSFNCQCRENFTLLPDGQSCRKEDDDGTALETTDFEFHQLDKRLIKLEELIGEVHKNEVTKSDMEDVYKKFGELSKDVDLLQTKVKFTDTIKNDVMQIRRKLFFIEKKASKIDDLSAKYDKMRKCAFLNKICI